MDKKFPSKKLVLKSGGQKILKWIHVTSAAISLGGILSLFALNLLKQGLLFEKNPFLIDLSILRIFDNVITLSFVGIVLTAVVFAIFTRWGFFKHTWIVVKWVGVIVLFVFVCFLIGPNLGWMTSLSDSGLGQTTAKEVYQNSTNQAHLLFLVMGLLFLVIYFISFFKPWGKRRKDSRISQKVQMAIVFPFLFFLIFSLVMQSVTLNKYRNMPIMDSNLSVVPDGKYKGEFDYGFVYKVNVTVSDHRIIKIEVIQNRDSQYARFAEGVLPRIIQDQNANVDTITGATTTSKCLMKAVENALRPFSR